MTISAGEYAAMASGSYGPSEGKDPLEKMLKFGRGTIDGSSFSVLESTDASTVYKKTTGEVVVAIKGTNKIGDWASNALIMVGALSSDPRTIDLVNLVRKYKRAGADVSVTGHSLGGALAAEVARNENVLGVTFNKGSGFSENLAVSRATSKSRMEKGQNVVNFITGVDPLSAGVMINPGGGAKTFHVDPNQVNPHSMNNFIGLDSAVYQPELDSRATSARNYRLAHPDEKIDEYSLDERVTNAKNDLMRILDMVENLKKINTLYQNRSNIARNWRKLPENFLSKVRSIGNRARALWSELKALRNTRSFGDFFNSVDKIKTAYKELSDETNFKSMVEDLFRDNTLGDASDAADQLDEFGEQLDDFDEYEDMEWYDERLDDMLQDDVDVIADDGEGLGLDFVDDQGVPGGEIEYDLEALEVEPFEMTEAVEMMTVNVALGFLGGVVVLWSVVSAIQNYYKRQAYWAGKAVELADVNRNFDQRFTGLVRMVHMSWARPLEPVGWSNRDIYGESVLAYLTWRKNHPEIYYTGGDGMELTFLGELYQRLLSPGAPLVVPDDAYDLMVLNNQNRAGLESYAKTLPLPSFYGPRTSAGDIHGGNGWDDAKYLSWYEGLAGYYASVNKQEYESELNNFISGSHERHDVGDMSVGRQGEWLYKYASALGPGLYDYVLWVFGLQSTIESLDTSNFGLADTSYNMRVAMKAFATSVASLILRNPGNENAKLIEFERTHTRAILFKGFEELTSVRVLDVWLRDRGRDLAHFQTYFSLGSAKLLQDTPRSVQEQVSASNLVQHHIEWDNLDYSAFVSSGMKPKGDNETISQFNERFDRWQTDKGRQMAFDSHYRPPQPVYRVRTAPAGNFGVVQPDVVIPGRVVKRKSDGTLWSCPTPKKKLTVSGGV